MAKQTIKVRRNADGTATVRIGRYVEHLMAQYMSPYELYEALRYACITAGIPVSDETTTELYRIVREIRS